MDAAGRFTISNGTEVSLETSWANAKDPKEKKKIQNRIAQRSYRQRMKARLERLQAKVNYHEQIEQEQMNLGNSPRDDDLQNRQQQPQQVQLRGSQEPHPPVTLHSMVPTCNSPDKQPMQPQPQPQVLQATFFEHTVQKGDKPFYMQPPQPINSATPPQQIPQNRPMLTDGTDQIVKASDKLQPDYMQMTKQQQQQQQMVNEHSTTPFTDLSPEGENARMMNPHQLFSSEVGDVVNVNHQFDVWTSEVLAQTRRHNSYPTDPLGTLPQQQQPQQQRQPSVVVDSPHTGSGDGRGSTTVVGTSTIPDARSSVSSLPPAEQGLDERFEDVLDCTRAAGFESFDALVTAYYNGNFDESSPLAIEQRLSRNRGLPKVVGDVFRNARGWSDWERWGFDEELLKTTESMLMSECEEGCSSLEDILSLLSTPQNGGSTPPSTGQAIPAMKKVIQNKFPNLWALMMALSAEHRDAWHRNRFNTVLAAILLLRYPGRIPNDQLLMLISGCL